MPLGQTKTYEDLLGDGLQASLSAASVSLDDLACSLNQRNVHSSTGKKWTATFLASELERLARNAEHAVGISGISQRQVLAQPFLPQPQSAEELKSY